MKEYTYNSKEFSLQKRNKGGGDLERLKGRRHTRSRRFELTWRGGRVDRRRFMNETKFMGGKAPAPRPAENGGKAEGGDQRLSERIGKSPWKSAGSGREVFKGKRWGKEPTGRKKKCQGKKLSKKRIGLSQGRLLRGKARAFRRATEKRGYDFKWKDVFGCLQPQSKKKPPGEIRG